MALGMVTRPVTLMWLSVGASAAIVAFWMSPCVASQRLAPSSSHCSRLSLPALQLPHSEPIEPISRSAVK